MRDPFEGTFSIELELAGQYSNVWLDAVTFGAMPFGFLGSQLYISFGPYPLGKFGIKGFLSGSVQHLQEIERTASHTTLFGKILLNYEHPNSLVLCLSGPKASHKDEEYVNLWQLDERGAPNFVKYVTDKVMIGLDKLEFKSKNLNDDILKYHPREIEAQSTFGQVQYSDRHFIVKDESEWNLQRLTDIFRHAPFIKTRDFSHEDEYRILIDFLVPWVKPPLAAGHKAILEVKDKLILPVDLVEFNHALAGDSRGGHNSLPYKYVLRSELPERLLQSVHS